eukprot:TRINITY_DN2956_c0_g1_i3.p2 TRINITY_DN2956_c0_g1~~TRINITY_DN2956_c0_g1_i3.p2  ORF type:complete len:150 (-),score=25.24 TRINITY_DN2956_c0_g1_i3:291-740(-)
MQQTELINTVSNLTKTLESHKQEVNNFMELLTNLQLVLDTHQQKLSQEDQIHKKVEHLRADLNNQQQQLNNRITPNQVGSEEKELMSLRKEVDKLKIVSSHVEGLHNSLRKCTRPFIKVVCKMDEAKISGAGQAWQWVGVDVLLDPEFY